MKTIDRTTIETVPLVRQFDQITENCPLVVLLLLIIQKLTLCAKFYITFLLNSFK